MAWTSTSDELRKAAAEARDDVKRVVNDQPGIFLNDLYDALATKAPRWQEPAVRTAIWDLIAERQLIVRRGNKLYPHD